MLKKVISIVIFLVWKSPLMLDEKKMMNAHSLIGKKWQKKNTLIFTLPFFILYIDSWTWVILKSAMSLFYYFFSRILLSCFLLIVRLFSILVIFFSQGKWGSSVRWRMLVQIAQNQFLIIHVPIENVIILSSNFFFDKGIYGCHSMEYRPP